MYQHYFSDSSFIKTINWYYNQVLIITFNSGSVWAYYEIPEELYFQFTKSNSLGTFFNNNIRNIYRSEVLFKISKNSKIIYSKDNSFGQEEK